MAGEVIHLLQREDTMPSRKRVKDEKMRVHVE